jgi:glyoxylase-like metal-dependent hydrolase (beta-lactamase superfamily II)
LSFVHNFNEHIWQVKMPLPYTALPWVNAYVVRGRDGFDIVDPGLHTQQTEAIWETVITDLGFRWEHIRSIVLTHHHPDHYGCAGWLQQRTHAPVKLSYQTWMQADHLWGEYATQTSDDILSLFITHGLPHSMHNEMWMHLESFVERVSPHPTHWLSIEDREVIQLGDEDYIALHTPGHAAGHLSFYQQETQRLFCGDHVLPGITPNVSLLPFGDPNPLATYLMSLQDVSQLTVEQALPGHREPFKNYNERIGSIQRHHKTRLALIEQRLSKPITAYELCCSLFGDRLSMHQLRFALSETLAHVIYLLEQGTIHIEGEGQIQFVKKL